MAFILRNVRKITDLPFTASLAISVWAYAGTDTMAAMLTAGYFNDLRARLKVNDVFHLVSSVDGTGDLLTVKVTAVPASGNVVVAADDDSASVVSARAVVPTADGLTTGLLFSYDSFVSVASADANHIMTLPVIANVPLGKEIWGKNGATACEMRTPATSNTKINGTDADSTEAVIAANVTFMVKKVAADEWALLTFTGGAVAAPTPD